MIEPPEIVQTTAKPIASIHLTVSWEDMQKVMGPSVAELLARVTKQGAHPVGEIYTHHFRRPTDTFDFEVCVPVSAPIAAEGRVQPGEWPAMKMVRTVYPGPYEGLEEAWPEFMEWIEKNGHSTTEELWESYTVGPHSNPDPAAWRTELSRRIVE